MGEELGDKSVQRESVESESDSVLEKAKQLEKEIDSVKERLQDKGREETKPLGSVLFDEDEKE